MVGHQLNRLRIGPYSTRLSSEARCLTARHRGTCLAPSLSGHPHGDTTWWCTDPDRIAGIAVEASRSSCECRWWLISDTLIDTELLTMSNSSGAEMKQLSTLTQLRKIVHPRAGIPNVHINLDPADFDLQRALPIPYSDIKTFSRISASQNTTRAVIVDTIACAQYTDVTVARCSPTQS